jgi:hypothetical protein
MTMWTPRDVGLETGRSAHHEGPMPGAAAILLAGRSIGFPAMPGEENDMKRHCTCSKEASS